MSGNMSGEMSGQPENANRRVSGWSAAAAQRLKAAVTAYGSQRDVAGKVGINRASLADILNGHARPKQGNFLAICRVVGVEVSEILGGEMPTAGGVMSGGAAEEEMVRVPLHDIAVSAGAGAMAIEEGSAEESLGFPINWLRRTFGDFGGLRLVRTKGDSMEPTLRDGDLLMIDTKRIEPIDGIYVVRIDDQLLVKRLSFRGAGRLLVGSDNEFYSRMDREFDVAGLSDGDFKLIGRAVWVGKAL